MAEISKTDLARGSLTPSGSLDGVSDFCCKSQRKPDQVALSLSRSLVAVQSLLSQQELPLSGLHVKALQASPALPRVTTTTLTIFLLMMS